MGAQTDANTTDWTIGRLLNWTSDYLTRHGVEDARLASEVLLAHATGCRRIDLYTWFERTVAGGQLDRFRDWVRRAAAGEPIAYIVEEKEFFSLAFRVTPDVLIPRPETEVLVECVLDHCARAGLSQPQFLDIGTGSGCIVVAVLTQLESARAVATDVSPAALTIAKLNAERHRVSDRLALVEADRLALPGEVVPESGFDVLMSNPPYVGVDGMDSLDTMVRKYEPAVALTNGGDGLSFYRSIAESGASLLAAGGVVIVEVANGQAASASEVLEKTGKFVHRETRTDRVVGQDRVVVFSLAVKA